MTQRLKAKTALITGASQGIGRATAELFAREGASLILLARDGPALSTLAGMLASAYGTQVRTICADLMDLEESRKQVMEAIDAAGGTDIVICNAGIGQYGPVSRTPWEHIERILRVNLEGALGVAHAALPSLLQRGGGSIVFVSSTLGKRTVPYNAAYSASKFGLHGFAEALRLEVKSLGVHVGIVCPARTDTPFFERMIYSIEQKRQRKVPVAPPEKVARAILRCVLRRRREIVVSLGGKFFSYVGMHFPRFSDIIIHRAVPKP